MTYKIIKIKSVVWDNSFECYNDLPTKNIYIIDPIGYKPSDILGCLLGCDVDNCEYEYIDELPNNVEFYASQYPEDHEDYENGALTYIERESDNV